MNIYFAGAITGGREFARYQQLIVRSLKKLGHKILSEHVHSDELQRKFRKKAEKSKNYHSYISKHDKQLIMKADLVVAECSQGSLGTGFEICYAAYILKIPVIALRFEKASGRASSTIFGDSSKLINPYVYNDKNLEQILTEALKKFTA